MNKNLHNAGKKMIINSQIPEKLQYSVEIDFVRDFEIAIYDSLKSMGYNPSLKGEQNIYSYLNVLKRNIKNTPRKVFISKELACPKECEQAFNEIVLKLKFGISVKPYMSKKINKKDAKDMLIYDWNIFHFHLNKLENKSAFVDRSDFLLFAYITNDSAYLLQIYKHNKESEPYLFSKIELIDIIESNWPNELNKYQINGAIGLSEPIDDKSIALFRKAGITSFTETKSGKVYISMGGGYMSNRMSHDVVRTRDNWINRINLYQDCFIKCINEIFDVLKQLNINDNNLNVKFLYFNNSEFTCLELNNKLIIQFLLHESKIRICEPYELYA